MKAQVSYFIFALGLVSAAVQASETFSVVPDSAQGLGIVGGRYANLSDASAVRVAPANILKIEKSELLINTALWHGDIYFTQNGGQGVPMNRPWVFPASMYFVQPVIPGRLAFGLGVSTPYGMAASYPKGMGGALRYALPYEATLMTVDITPAVAVKITDDLSFAVGLDILYADLSLKQFYSWNNIIPGSPEGDIKINGQGWGMGAYAGINWTFAKRHRFAVIGRLPVKVNLNGDFKASNIPPALAGTFSQSSSFQSDITFPGSISVGYGFDVTDRFTVGFDFKWAQNSSHDDLPILIGNNQPLLGGSTGTVFGWRNSIDLGTGMSYQLNENWALRAGYLFSENSQPQNSYTPLVPGNDRHVFSLGVGWRGKTRGVDLTYAYVYYPTRVISGAASTPANQYDGNYNHQWHVLSLSVTQRF
ncbi:outer membrane protein transport protein [Prosthecobacter sp.]|uniref:OmpP1/FadL family transporter n=1 Tax=Prosthecobacter sp. TaxID=1965333 RepID=UPI0024891807|nr:outer membrane protein transport protein [Prosthecobacter sp.]MDI1312366.1 outer membrane protein transport protein [Prosthecobacter sp.]